MNQDDLIRKTPKKMLDAMGAVVVGQKEKAKIMEVIGEQGQKVGEYIDMPDKPHPYHILKERHVL